MVCGTYERFLYTLSTVWPGWGFPFRFRMAAFCFLLFVVIASLGWRFSNTWSEIETFVKFMSVILTLREVDK